jgi:FO synthase
MRTAALARLIFGPEVNIQIPPNLTSPDFGRLLRAGTNDWGGISPVTRDFINPERRWPAVRALRRVTEDAGYELRERLAVYPEFVRARGDFIPKTLEGRVAELVDEAGLVRPAEERW